MSEPTWCDDCGGDISEPDNQYPVESLPVNIASANAGESAVLCGGCYEEHIISPRPQPKPMSEPTPTALYVGNTGNHQGIIIEEGTGRNVAVTYDKDDAPRIVKAVNLHDDLVAALRGIYDATHIDADELHLALDALSIIRAEARATLAKLEADA